MRKMQRGFEIVYCLLPKVKLTETKIVETKKMCPDITFSPKQYVQYPDEKVLARSTLGDLQPMKLGLMRLSLRAQFGKTREFKSGLNLADYQVFIDQCNLEQKVAIIEFRRREYDVIHFHFQFIFKTRDETVIG